MVHLRESNALIDMAFDFSTRYRTGCGLTLQPERINHQLGLRTGSRSPRRGSAPSKGFDHQTSANWHIVR